MAFEIYNRPGLVASFGSERVAKFEYYLNESKRLRELGIGQEDPKPSRPVIKKAKHPLYIYSDDSDSDDSDDQDYAFEVDNDKDGLTSEEIHKWDREDRVYLLPRPSLSSGGGRKQIYTCIWSDGVGSYTEDTFIGFMWIAVHGRNSICVAARIHDMEREWFLRMLKFESHPDLCRIHLQKGLIGKVEGFVDPIRFPPHPLRETMKKKPFAVVSLIPSTTTGVNQETGDDAARLLIKASSAVEYLKEKLKSGSDFDPDETIQTAISALQHQCNQKVTADDIWVCVLREGDDMCLQRREIEEHLAEINNHPTTEPFADRCQ